jgi:hypothetical protein
VNERGARVLVAGLVAVNLLVGTLAATRDTSSGQRVASVAARGSEGTTSSTTTTIAASDEPLTVDTTPGDAVPPTSDVSTTPTPGGPDSSPSTTAPSPPEGPSCHNSHDPACGDFYWSPAAANTALTLQTTFEPAEPHVGDVVTFHVTAVDNESKVGGAVTCFGESACLPRTDGPAYSEIGYGPWAPMVRPTTFTMDFQHTYSKSGTFSATVVARSFSYYVGEDCPGNPSDPAGSFGFNCFDPFAENRVDHVSVTVNP